MGSSQVIDQSIKIFMVLNKKYYTAGEYVSGEIYIRAAKPSLYSRLILNLHGLEYVFWQEGTGQNNTEYKNKHDSYDCSFVVKDFKGKLHQNDYIFPFTFLLPSKMTGSFYQSQDCFLKYILKAELVHNTEPIRNHFYQIFLNIIQPPRTQTGPITVTRTIQSKFCEQCCGCCTDYGAVSVTLNCNKNFTMNGDKININGVIDNTRGKTKITRSKVCLQKKRCLIPSDADARISSLEQFQYYQIGPVQTGDSSNFNFNAKVPQLVQCTAIGKILSIYYVLYLYTDYGCCQRNADVQLHIIVHSKTPLIYHPQTIPPLPLNWNPQRMQKVICCSMRAFIYTPDPRLPFRNLPTNQMMAEQAIKRSSSSKKKLYSGLKNEQKQRKNNDRYQPYFNNERVYMDYKSEQSQDAIIKSEFE